MSEKTISTPRGSAKGDDRNLVPVDPANANSLEDQAYLFWKKNRNFIYGATIVVLAAAVAFQVVRSVQASHQAEISRSFGAATTIEAKRAFARANPDSPLAGVAWLDVADDDYTNGRYDDAIHEYASAAAALNEPVLSGRARLGQGIATLKAGQVTEGESLLHQLSDDANALMAYRTQAYYELASYYAGAGDRAKAREAIDRLKALDPEGYWASMGSALRSRIDAEEQTAAAPEGAAPQAEAPAFKLPAPTTTPVVPAPAPPPAGTP